MTSVPNWVPKVSPCNCPPPPSIASAARTRARTIRSPAACPPESWLGYSTAHWEGDTLVVETAGLKDNTWLDLFGHLATDALRVTERFHRRDLGNMDLEITMADAKAYTKPRKITLRLKLMPDSEILELVCVEGNRGMDHRVGK